MVVYILVAFFLFVGVIAKKQSNMIYKIGIVLLFLITAFRNPILGGSDYYVYSDYFERVPTILNWSYVQGSYFEVGYQILNALVKQISYKYITFQIVYSLIVIALLHRVVKQLEFSYVEKSLFLFSFFCFHFIWDMWIIFRQNIADLIFWILLVVAYKYRKEKKRKWVLIAIIACTFPALFHTSALANVLLFPVMILLGKIDSKKRLVLVPAVSLFLYFFGDKIYQLATSIATIYLRESYSNYTQTDSSFINYLLRLFFFILFAWHYPFERHLHKDVLFDALTMMVIIGSFTDIVTTRLYEYYAIGLYGSMALFLNNFTKRSKYLVSVIYGIAMLIIMIRFVFNFDDGAFMQYTLFSAA